MSFTNMQDASARKYKEREAQNGTAGTAAQQQKHEQQWSAWFKRQLANEDDLFKAFGESLADLKRELRNEFEPLIMALKEKNDELEDRVKQLEAQLSLDSRFKKLELDLAARQEALNEARRGAPGKTGTRGARGERGERGEKGEPGKPAEAVYIESWKLDRQGYCVSPLYTDGHVGGTLEFKEFYLQFLSDRGEE